jgi:hypothetical protein
MLKVQMLPGPTLGIGVDMVEESIRQVPQEVVPTMMLLSRDGKFKVRRRKSSEPDPTAFRTPIPMIFSRLDTTKENPSLVILLTVPAMEDLIESPVL